VEKQILNTNAPHQSQDISYRSFLVVIRYPKLFSFFGFLSMALFHLPLAMNKNIAFYKLMGTGKNGSFDIWPDLSQWSVMVFYKKEKYSTTDFQKLTQKILGGFIFNWLRFFKAETRFFHLEPYAGHGTWDNRSFIAQRKTTEEPVGKIAVLTRATISIKGLIPFWKAVPSTSLNLNQQPGFIYSIGIGEVPLIKQATFSIWSTESHMKAYAYQMRAHQEVIRRTRTEKWYAEEMFLRFKLLEEYSNQKSLL
jgi:hypothetical protein